MCDATTDRDTYLETERETGTATEPETETHIHTDVGLYKTSLEGYRIIHSGSENVWLKAVVGNKIFSPVPFKFCSACVLPYIRHSANMNEVSTVREVHGGNAQTAIPMPLLVGRQINK